MRLIRDAGLSRIRTQAFALGAIPVVFFLLLLSAVGVLRSQTENAAALVQHTDEVLGVEGNLTSSLIRASIAVNRFVKRPDAAHKRTLRSALGIEPLARDLLLLVGGNTAQERRAAAIAVLTREFVDTYGAAAAAYAAHDLRKASRILNSTRAQGLSSAWTTQTSAFESAETALRADRWAKLHAQYQESALVLAFGSVIAIGLTMLSAIAFGRRIVARVERLAAAVRGMTGEAVLPDVIEGDDEIVELDRAYHEMAQIMRDRETQLEKYLLLAKHA
ncbi:MAG TPA: hypothetical protein VFN37_01200, partial [Candidatus Baltobacteraceae bacterium]|nr:hypothetical protein [Candidatus Baltobacteraceae bacterium]